MIANHKMAFFLGEGGRFSVDSGAFCDVVFFSVLLCLLLNHSNELCIQNTSFSLKRKRSEDGKKERRRSGKVKKDKHVKSKVRSL